APRGTSSGSPITRPTSRRRSSSSRKGSSSGTGARPPSPTRECSRQPACETSIDGRVGCSPDTGPGTGTRIGARRAPTTTSSPARPKTIEDLEGLGDVSHRPELRREDVPDDPVAVDEVGDPPREDPERAGHAVPRPDGAVGVGEEHEGEAES